MVVESDGEESVGTSEVGIIAESEEEQNQAEKPEMLQDLSSDPDYDADLESILPLFEDRLGYGIEEEGYEESPVRARVVGVYMSPLSIKLDQTDFHRFRTCGLQRRGCVPPTPRNPPPQHHTQADLQIRVK